MNADCESSVWLLNMEEQEKSKEDLSFIAIVGPSGDPQPFETVKRQQNVVRGNLELCTLRGAKGCARIEKVEHVVSSIG